MLRNSGLRPCAGRRILTVTGFFLMSVNALAGTYYIAANGSDSNSGTTTSTPWLHAPGMPKCTANCAAHTPVSGDRFVLRGGDTWHFGNSAAAPYTGGTWDVSNWWGTESTCVYDGTQTGCIYYGVDKTWFTGASWSRPILNADNPLSTSKVSSCAYQVGSSNNIVKIAPWTILDNFEMLGLCTSSSGGTNGDSNTYVVYGGTGTGGRGMAFELNLYIHGWTITGASTGAIPCNSIGGGYNGLQTIDHVVIDGSDSLPGACAWGVFPSFYHFKNNMIRYTTQGVGAWCHDIHDNIFEHIYNPSVPTHGNVLECNSDSDGTAVAQPQNTPNVIYNNIFRHYDPTFGSSGQVNLWVCPNTIPEYWFNNIAYDTGMSSGNFWAIAGTLQYPGCTNTGRQYMFNNTFSGGYQPCHLSGSNPTGGQYLTVVNEHLIGTTWDSPGCAGGQSDPSNITMSFATGAAQGYTLGTRGTADSDTCANDSTKPCSPTSSTNATVGKGANYQQYCTALAGYASERAISVDAATACKYGTTNACRYDTTTHSMKCPGQTPVARSASSAWDVGAYQFSGAAGSSGPVAPTSVQAVVR
jgi:hypothetical protein